MEIAIGSWTEVQAFLTIIKDAREKSGLKVDLDYFRPVNSGAVDRFVTGWYLKKMEELDGDSNMGEMYDKYTAIMRMVQGLAELS